MEEFPSGQRGQTVNLLRLASVVRIHPLPPRKSNYHLVVAFSFCSQRRGWIRKPVKKTSRWDVFRAWIFSGAASTGSLAGDHPAMAGTWPTLSHQTESGRNSRSDSFFFPQPLRSRRKQHLKCPPHQSPKDVSSWGFTYYFSHLFLPSLSFPVLETLESKRYEGIGKRCATGRRLGCSPSRLRRTGR